MDQRLCHRQKRRPPLIKKNKQLLCLRMLIFPYRVLPHNIYIAIARAAAATLGVQILVAPIMKCIDKKRTVGVALTELYSYVCPLKEESCAKSWHMAMEDVKMTWAIFLYYVTSVSYNEIKWKNYSKVKWKSMIPAYKTYERSVQKRKFNGC